MYAYYCVDEELSPLYLCLISSSVMSTSEQVDLCIPPAIDLESTESVALLFMNLKDVDRVLPRLAF